MTFYTLPGLPSDLMTSNKVNHRRLKTEGTVNLSRGSQLDAFGRLRVSQPTAIWYDALSYDKSPLLWSEVIQGDATSVHSYADNAAVMSVFDTGDVVRRTTRVPIRYQPGKSRLDVITWGLPTLSGDVRFRAGAFSVNDGIFIQIHNNQFAFGVRSSVSGTVTDTIIPQSEWNGDKLDGTGQSRITLDPTKGHIFITDLQWLSLGIIRFGFELDGEFILAHKTQTANTLTRPYMQTANLPICYEIESLGGTGTVSAICSASLSEGGSSDEKGFNFTASNGRTAKTATATDAWSPIVSIRRASIFKGNPYFSALIIPTKFAAFVQDAPAQFGVFYRSVLTGAVWEAVNTESGVEKDTTATAMTGGVLSDTFYLAAGGQGSGTFSTAGGSDTQWLLPIACDCAGADYDIVTVAARAIGNTSAQAYAAMDYREIR